MKKELLPCLIAAFFSVALVSCGSKPKAVQNKVEEVEEKVEETKQTVEETIPQTVDNTDALSKADAARQAAVDAGADSLCPVQFAAADVLYKSLKPQAEAGVDVSAALADVQARFEGLAEYSKAVAAKKRIDELNFAQYDQKSYDAGCSTLEEIDAVFNQTNLVGSEFLEKAKSANGSFINVLNAGFKKLAKDERIEAFNAKRNADGVKAGVAAKADYNEAADEFRAGDSSYAMQNPESAYNHYKAAKEKFTLVYEAVSERRAAAQKAIDDAKAQVEASQSYAVSADEKAPLEGDDIQGIEAADAKLLEDDNYEDPASVEASIPENIDDVNNAEVSEPEAAVENEAAAEETENAVTEESAEEAE